MVIEAEKDGFRERLSHQPGRTPVVAPDVSDLGTAFELVDYSIKRGQPFLHKMMLVARAEEARRSAEQTFAAPIPADSPVGLEGIRYPTISAHPTLLRP